MLVALSGHFQADNVLGTLRFLETAKEVLHFFGRLVEQSEDHGSGPSFAYLRVERRIFTYNEGSMQQKVK